MKRRTRIAYQPQRPPRRSVGVEFPMRLFAGIESIAAMERWSLSRTVVEVVDAYFKGKRARNRRT